MPLFAEMLIEGLKAKSWKSLESPLRHCFRFQSCTFESNLIPEQMVGDILETIYILKYI